MSSASRYDVFLKMLEIILHDVRSPSPISNEERQTAITVIQNIEGDLKLKQILKEETVNTGDKFENISNSIIATRGSIATGVIKIRDSGEPELAGAIEELAGAIEGAPSQEMPEELKAEALDLVDELVKQASSGRAKSVLKAMGNGLLKTVEGVKSMSPIVASVWPVIERL